MLVHFLYKLVPTSDGQSLEDLKGYLDVLFTHVGDPIEAKMTEKLNPRTIFWIDCTFDYKCWSFLRLRGS